MTRRWSLCMLRKIWWSLVPFWATWFRESSLRKRRIPTPPRRRKIAKWGLRRKMRLSFFYNMTDVFFRSDQRWISPVPKTSFPHTNLGILIFRICENAVPSLYVARRPVTGCDYVQKSQTVQFTKYFVTRWPSRSCTLWTSSRADCSARQRTLFDYHS